MIRRLYFSLHVIRASLSEYLHWLSSVRAYDSSVLQFACNESITSEYVHWLTSGRAHKWSTVGPTSLACRVSIASK